MTRAALGGRSLILQSHEPDWRQAVPKHTAEQILHGHGSLDEDIEMEERILN